MKKERPRRPTAKQLREIDKLAKGKVCSVMLSTGISAGRAGEANFKAQLITGVLDAIESGKVTPRHLAVKSGLSPSTVNKILGGSIQKVTIRQVLKLVGAAGLSFKLKIYPATLPSR